MSTDTATANGTEKREAARQLLAEGKTTAQVRAEIARAYGGIGQQTLTDLRREIGLPAGASAGIPRNRRSKKGPTAPVAEREAMFLEKVRAGWGVMRALRFVRRKLGRAIDTATAYRLTKGVRGNEAPPRQGEAGHTRSADRRRGAVAGRPHTDSGVGGREGALRLRWTSGDPEGRRVSP